MEKRQNRFEKRIRLWTVIVPLITCVVTSLTAIGIAYFSSLTKHEQEVVIRMSVRDFLETHRLEKEINVLEGSYFRADEDERKRIDIQLRQLAERDAAIMRKYDPDYEPRWPPSPHMAFPSDANPPPMILLICLVCFFTLASYLVCRRLSRNDQNSATR